MELSATNVTVAITVLAATVYYYLTKSWDYWKKRGVAGPKPQLIWGNIADITFRRTTPAEAYEKIYNAYPREKLVGIFRFWHPTVVLRDLDLLQHVLIRDFDNFYDRGFSIGSSGVGKNLFQLDGDPWRMLRSRISPIFTSGKLKNMFPLITGRAETYMDYLKSIVDKSQDVDVCPLLQKFTMGAISSCAFGFDLDYYKTDEALAKIDELTFTTNYAFDIDVAFPGLLRFFNLTTLPANIGKFFHGLVQSIMKERKGIPSNRKDFMDLLLELRNAGQIYGSKKHEDEKERILQIDDELMAAQAFAFYAAGYETSAATLAYMFYQLARNQDVQERLVREIEETLAQNGGELTFNSLKELTYLRQVLDETQRMYSVANPLTRRAVAKYTIPGTEVTIDKGTIVVVPINGIHYDANIYPDPHKFDPDRFTPENIKNRHPCAFMPFGLGPRNCIGMRFANVQSMVCAVNVLTKYRLLPSTQTPEPIKYDPYRFGVSPINGISLKMVLRE